ncbi:Undecaprenyl-diphosphatase [Chlamydiales bacterium STE3]|nr:Undecaprenyl-diphosphatase [Chlamydiales bacterium STE3]
MSPLKAIFLGLIQGVTEFFPVSSSGHLILFQKLLGFENLEKYVLFDLICHFGTLFAVLIVFFKEIRHTLFDKQSLLQIGCGTLPLFPIAFLLHPLKSLFNQVEFLGYFFFTTALILYLGEKVAKREHCPQRSSLLDALKIGCFQAFAVLPGVSRSGSTISGAKMLGWQPEKAVVFSFLLSIPAILGGIILESREVLAGNTLTINSLGFFTYVAGFLTAFVTGFFALKLLIRIAIKDKFRIFIWYCIAVGSLTLFLFH